MRAVPCRSFSAMRAVPCRSFSEGGLAERLKAIASKAIGVYPAEVRILYPPPRKVASGGHVAGTRKKERGRHT